MLYGYYCTILGSTRDNNIFKVYTFVDSLNFKLRTRLLYRSNNVFDFFDGKSKKDKENVNIYPVPDAILSCQLLTSYIYSLKSYFKYSQLT